MWPYFRNVLGAIDGTHIPIECSANDRPCYRNRSGNLTINVLAVCDFNMYFRSVVSGWEGSAPDGLIFEAAMKAGDLVIPPGKMLLADAGFGYYDGLLRPYSGVRYHLKEWQTSKQR